MRNMTWIGYVTSEKGVTGVAIVWGDGKAPVQKTESSDNEIRRLRKRVMDLLDENKELRVMNEYLRKECKAMRSILREGKGA